MEAVKLFHTADLHFRPDQPHRDKCIASLVELWERAVVEKPLAILISGDIFDGAVRNADRDGFDDLMIRMQMLLNVAPVFAIYGTPTHDLAGSLEVFTYIMAPHGFVIVEPDHYYLVGKSQAVFPVRMIDEVIDISPALVIMGCPEPNKGWLLASQAGKSVGAAETTALLGAKMRELFAGYGAMRKKYANSPCVFMYHGLVRGAHVPDQAFTNSFTVTPDDLYVTGADYYALGDIHIQHAVAYDPPMVYPGPAYPTAWDEWKQAGFVLVEMSRFYHGVTHDIINYPHRTRKKIVVEVAPSSIIDINPDQVNGSDVWLVLRGSEDQIKKEDHGRWIDALEGIGAGPETRVTTEVVKEHAVRDAGIVEAKGLGEKLRRYEQYTESTMPAGAIDKAALLEGTVANEGFVGAPGRFRVRYLNIRGAIGIRKGAGLEEIEVDFDDYEQGLIALVGGNGSGKTTLLHMLSPHADLPARSANVRKWADMFELRESWRHLTIEDRLNGVLYRCELNIDGVNEAGKVQWWIHSATSETLEWKPLNDGRKESYSEYVNKIFGSFSLYMQSVYITQKDTKLIVDGKAVTTNLAEATDAQLKVIASELLGLSRYSRYAEIAHQYVSDTGAVVALDEARAETLANIVIDLPTKQEERAKAALEVSQIEEEATMLGGLLVVAEKKEQELRAAHDNNKAITEKKGDLSERSAGLADKIHASEARIEMCKSAAENIEGWQKTIKTYDNYAKEERGILDEKAQHDAARTEELEAYLAERQALEAKNRELQLRADSKKQSISEQFARISDLRARAQSIRDAEKEPFVDTCYICHQKLPAENIQRMQAERNERLLRANSLEDQWDKTESTVKLLESDLKQIEANQYVYPEAPEEKLFAKLYRLTHVQEEIKKIGIDSVRDSLETAQQAVTEIAGLEQNNELHREEIASMRRESEALQAGYKNGADLEWAEAGAKVLSHKVLLAETREKASAARERRDQLKARVDELVKFEVELIDLNKKRRKSLEEISQWEWLEGACGRDGIQALELDAAAPSISAIANRLLGAAYGTRFGVRFQTTKLTGRGSKRKLSEAFAIMVYDNETGEEQPIDTLSGGEEVWIKKALYDAFGILRAQATGLQFDTVFLDEADGALEPEKRKKYFDLLSAAHSEAGRHQTIVVSHSRDIQAMMPQEINMRAFIEVVA